MHSTVRLTIGMNQKLQETRKEVFYFLFLSLFSSGQSRYLSRLIHFVVPECLIGFEPVCHFFKLVELSVTISFPALLFDGDQSAFCKDADMFGDGRPAYIKMFCNAVERQVLPAEQLENLSAGGVCDGLKNITSHEPEFATKINVTGWILIFISQLCQ